MRQITHFILHHLGGWPPNSPEDLNAQSVADHFAQTPYHYAVTQDGTVWACRPEEVVSAANLGLNRTSISICMLGNFDSEANPSGQSGPKNPTNAQLLATGELVGRLHRKYPSAIFIQHKDVHKLVPTCLQNGSEVSTATACPGSRITETGIARFIWLIACGLGLGEARNKMETELAGDINKHNKFVAELDVIGPSTDDHAECGELLDQSVPQLPDPEPQPEAPPTAEPEPANAGYATNLEETPLGLFGDTSGAHAIDLSDPTPLTEG